MFDMKDLQASALLNSRRNAQAWLDMQKQATEAQMSTVSQAMRHGQALFQVGMTGMELGRDSSQAFGRALMDAILPSTDKKSA